MINRISTILLCTIITLTTSMRNIGAKETVILGDRPVSVQKIVDREFDRHKAETPPGFKWLHNGSYNYCLLGLDDDKLLRFFASDQYPKNDIYLVDIGCGDGEWGENAFTVLCNASKNSNKQFHIFSVTGGSECDEKTISNGHVTLHQHNQFKIENVDEEFVKLGFSLENKVDLLVSRWTLRHLVDPFGTLKRLYSLLTPAHGILMSNGFLFKTTDSNEVQAFPLGNYNLLSSSPHTTVLYRYNQTGRDAHEFLLMRHDDADLAIPLAYTGGTSFLTGNYQCASQQVTVFTKTMDTTPHKKDTLAKMDGLTLYCNKDDRAAHALYTYLDNHHLFID